MRIGGGGYGRLRQGGDAKASNPWTSLRRIVPWIIPYWPTMLFGIGCMIVNTFLNLQHPRVMAFLVDKVLIPHRGDLVGTALFYLVGITLGSLLTGFLRTFFLHVAGQHLLHELRVRLYDHFQRLSLTYYDNRQTGDLMSRMTGDVEQIENIMVHGLDVFLQGLLGMFIAFGYMYGYHPRLALLVLIPVPVLAVSIFLFSGWIRKVYRGIRDRVGDMNAKLQDNISGIRVVKAFTREAYELRQIGDASRQVRDMNVRGIRMWSSFGPTMHLVGSMGGFLVIGLGASLVIKGTMEPGQLIAFFMYVGNFYSPIASLFQFFDSIQRSLAAGERIIEVLDTAPDVQDPAEPAPLETVRGEVEFRGLSFRYATGEEVLHDVNLTAQPGQRIALVGRSGAGKTSFINLIPRFYDAREGAVLVDGHDVRTLRQTELRKHIALVLQETFLFNGTVRDNLRFGKLDADDTELEHAARAANAYEFIERLPNGFDTEIGERGVKLSGGQKQRLAIARAVLADPRILILDEATSSVDSESEFLIHQALERLMDGRTTFVIAHRLSTIRSADVILVLENGSVVERGNHAALLHADGLYAQMYRQQFWLDDRFADDEDAEDDGVGAGRED
jgi:ABC-type multidrug transport system fused ATPase/permease subunit